VRPTLNTRLHTRFVKVPCLLVMLMSCLAPCTREAYAQMGPSQTNTIAPQPSNNDLQNPVVPSINNSPTPQVAPVPVIEPARTPQDQARINQMQMQQIAAQQAGQQLSPQQQPLSNQPVAPQLVPVTAPQAVTPQATAPQATPDQPAPAAAMPEPAAQATQPSSAAATEKTPPVVPLATPAEQQAIASNTGGFAPQNATGTLPLNQGQMPLVQTNPGMDMNINPALVGGTGVDAYGNPVAVPYEVQLEQRTREIQVQAREMAYEQAKKSVLPLEQTEIKDVLGRLKDTQEAIQTPVRPAPKPGNVIETISTDPSATPKVIRLAAGNVTTLNIVDVTGEPWPIVDLGFGGAFDVKPPEPGGHVIRITPLKDFARGNLVVRLLKMTTPITFSLQAGGKTVNYRFDARIPEYGPNAKMPILDNGINAVAGDKTTTAFLEGVPPKGSEKLTVAGIDGRTSAYKYGGALYVRTPLSLISPAWQGSATSADGMNVFVLNDAPVLLLSDNGSLVRARISDAKKDANGF